MLFSATMPPPIEKLAKKFLKSPKRIEVSRAASNNTNITAFKVRTESRKKRETLRWLLQNDLVESAIIFANRKTTVREVNKSLQSHGFASGEIHGDMDQASRIKELDRFKAGTINILVASDVAARGLDIKGVSHVFNFDAPWHPDDYVHRIGRTGRAGAKGRAFTLVTAEDAEAVENIEKLTGSVIPTFGQKDVRVELKPTAVEPAREVPGEQRQEQREQRSSPRARHEATQGDRHAESAARREERAPRDASRRERPREDAGGPVPPGEWNGPMPDFLGVSALA
jgi:superfamily II DNA/RNA helicase